MFPRFPSFVPYMAERRNDKLLGQVAERIRDLRKERALTQTAVYEDTGLSIGRIEAGSMNLTLTTISILCDYFEITLEEFFRGIR